MANEVLLLINNRWARSSSGRSLDIINPATEEVIGTVAVAEKADLDCALKAALLGFEIWRDTSPYERSKMMRTAAGLIRERSNVIAQAMTLEQGKPLAESMTEITACSDIIDWFAEEARRSYGRVVPARSSSVSNTVVREPVGPVAAFTPWNFPANQVARKLCGALAAGCSIIIKGPEETPTAPAELIRAFVDAGVPAGVISLVFGLPAFISEYLIPHPTVRKVSFTGSTQIGKQLAALAGAHMKRVTMELGGHAPAIVSSSADVKKAASLLIAAKYRNAGQACIAPTRFLIHRTVYSSFLEEFIAGAKAIKVGDGFASSTTMGPLANARRVVALDSLIEDAVDQGASLLCGGKRIGTRGYFFEPTILANVSSHARIMNDEPFGPVAVLNQFSDLDEAIKEANRVPYGLACYAFTNSTAEAARVCSRIEAGMMSINHLGLALPELPFGGVKDSGYGSEGGIECVEGYLTTKLITQMAS